MVSKKIKTNDDSAISDKYKKMKPHEHVLALPDTYIGGVMLDSYKMWVYNEDTKKLIYKQIEFVPGLYKIFDEILVNSRDHSVTDKTCRNIKIDINKETGCISCWNDGNNGIPIIIHSEYKIYIPELIFGHLLTSGHYDEKKKTVGGKNGFGAKLANIFSSSFYIEVGDKERGIVYKQQFGQNMYKKDNPVITNKTLSGSYTFIKFTPDFKRFGIDGLTDDIVSLFNKRVFDIAATTRENVNVFLNGEKLGITNFEEYIKMHYEDDDSDNEEENNDGEIVTGEDNDNPLSFNKRSIYEKINDRWEIGVVYDPVSGHRQMSYVNGICTFKGGRHVDYIVNQVIKGVTTFIATKHKDLAIKPAHIKDNITIFINSVIEDPAFSSQTKEELTTKISDFGSECKLSDDLIKKLSKTGIVDEIVNFAKLKAMVELKKSDGKKRSNLNDIDKYDGAHWAGTKKSSQCRLFLTEGDSAKAFAKSGISLIGRDRYGVFPLKGKLLNVREAKVSQLANNEEIKKIKKIMGFKQNKKYTSVKDLRYGGIVILTDSDVDGSHIKGLIMNFIHYFWPSLLKIDGFIQSMATPIVKAWKASDPKKKNPKIFYTMTEYENWKKTLPNGSFKSNGWKSKYYKGLGTSDEKEAKDAFNDFEKRLINYIWNDNVDNKNDDELATASDKSTKNDNLIEEDDGEDISEVQADEEEDFIFDKQNKNYDSMTLAFAKIRAEDRKKWLKNYNRELIIENNVTNVPFTDFINKDLIHFSNYSCVRSIPSICDGFKPGQRKIMFVSMKEKHGLYKNEIKVAQLAGYVSAEAEYHHGEVSLQETIIGMAQNFVSSNNLNLLMPSGNFGNRSLGGKDASSPRYIFTQLNHLVSYIFRKEDEKIYKFVEEDGVQIEPEYYVPIVPMILINGSAGIGTGFSSNVPNYKMQDVISCLRSMLDGKEPSNLKPFYRGFKGNIIKLNDSTYRTSGIYESINETTIKITELPIYCWTQTYVEWLRTLIPQDKKKPGKNQIIESIKDDSGNNNVCITITFLDGILLQLIKAGKLEKTLKLYKNVSTNNMHLYNSSGVIQKFHSIQDILKSFYTIRNTIYERRKEHYLKILENDMNLLKYKIQFLKYVLDGKIVVWHNKKAISREVILAKIEELNFPKLSTNTFALNDDKTYSYITNIKLFDITPEDMAKLEDEFAKILNEYNIYKETSVKTIWLNELAELEAAYDKWLIDNTDDSDENNKKTKKKVPIKSKKGLTVNTKK